MSDARTYDFTSLTDLDPSSLLNELADTHTTLANLHTRVGFLKSERIRDKTSYAAQELPEAEARVQACEEKKWLIVALIKNWQVANE